MAGLRVKRGMLAFGTARALGPPLDREGHAHGATLASGTRMLQAIEQIRAALRAPNLRSIKVEKVTPANAGSDVARATRANDEEHDTETYRASFGDLEVLINPNVKAALEAATRDEDRDDQTLRERT